VRRTASLLSAVAVAVTAWTSAAAWMSAPVAADVHAAPEAGTGTSPAPGWRIVASYPAGSSIDSVAASGQNSAWAVERCAKPCQSGDGLILLHWNGKAWQPQPQPASAKHTGDDEPQFAITPGSPLVWAFYNIYNGKLRSTAVEWTGKSWAAPTLFPAGVSIQAAVAPSPSAVWALGHSDDLMNPRTLRYNGKAWQAAPSPGFSVGSADASAAAGIWAVGIADEGPGFAISHWNGTRWVSQKLPAPSGPGATAAQGALVVSGPDNVWAFGYFAFTGAGTTDWLVHWNGKAWSNVKVPYPLNSSIMARLGADARGGAWFAATAANSSREYLYHVSASGHWLRTPVPALPGTTDTEISGFAPIPGSTSVYAYGQVTISSPKSPLDFYTKGVILKYGK
jgi:hypothetical protein